jgi:photosystem II stability/assembly factor-like uncharacterized protein
VNRLALACSVLAWCAIAGANGRPPASSTITFQQGNPQHIVAGMTFGVLVSSDGGRTWSWICEAAFPYAGVYDPDMLDTESGALFATTFKGLKVMRDGCSFGAVSLANGHCDGPKSDPCYANVFLSKVVAGGGSAMYATASSPYDSRIYRSADDGHTFDVLSSPGDADEYWQSFAIAPSNPKRIYLAGYRFTTQCDAHSTNAGSACRLNSNCTGSGTGSAMPKCTTVKTFSLFRSDDAGATWSSLSQANLPMSQSSAITIVGIDPADANQVYVHVSAESGGTGDAVYKSANGGSSAWTKVFETKDPSGLVMLVRSNGGLIAATETSGAFSSAGGSACVDQSSCKWTRLANAPHINCLVEQPDNKDIWACTRNYGNGSNIASDGAGIMKTSDLATWTPMLKYADIAGPVSCGSDKSPAQQCVVPNDGRPSVWCCLVDQLGIKSTAVACTGAYACTEGAEPPSRKASSTPAKHGGCCDAGGGSEPGALLLGALTLLCISRRRC